MTDNNLQRAEQKQPHELLDLLAELGYQNIPPETISDVDAIVNGTEVLKLRRAMAIFHAVAKDVQKELHMKNYSIVYALNGVLRHWESK